MADVGGCFFEDDVLRDIDGEVADTFKPAANEDQVEVVSVLGAGMFDFFGEQFGCGFVDFLQAFFTLDHGQSEFGVIIAVGDQGVRQHTGGGLVEPLDVNQLLNFLVFNDFARSFGYADRLIGDAFEVGGGFHRGDHHAQIAGKRTELDHQLHAHAVDFDFELVFVFVIGDGLVAQFPVTFEKASHGMLEVALCSRPHADGDLFQISEGFVEGAEDMCS